MKSLTIHTLVVAAALALSGTPSLAAAGEFSTSPVSQVEKDMHNVTAATSADPFHALSGLDARSLEEQEMTDQELDAVDGGMFADNPLAPPRTWYMIDLGFYEIAVNVETGFYAGGMK
jgi:hypothetical protein